MPAATAPTPALARLTDQVRAAAAGRRPLLIEAGGTKRFYGNATSGERLDPRESAGIVDYEPTELVVTVRAGTRLAELEATLEERGQMLGFEPPHFGDSATVGGCVAAGLAGPRRAAAGVASGAIRDSLLGAKLLDGRGAVLSFGGTVMKNVAGYDVSRLLAGSLGTLGVLLELSIRLAPRPSLERTLRLDIGEQAGLERCIAWNRRGWPISATLWERECLYVRLSGARAAVIEATRGIGGEPLDEPAAEALWVRVREQGTEFFAAARVLWRVSVPACAPPLALPGEQLIEWGGALRWLSTPVGVEEIRARAAALGGHATLFRGHAAGTNVFTPRAPVVARLESRIRAEFDPAGIFNPGRMYANEAG